MENFPRSAQRELTIGYWIAKHRGLLHHMHIAWWTAVAVLMSGLFSNEIIQYFAHRNQTRDIWASFPVSAFPRSAFVEPEPLSLTNIQSAPHDSQSIDIVFTLINPNEHWGARDVAFEAFVSGVSLGVDHATLAPGQQKTLAKTSIPAQATTTTRVDLVEVHWEKVGDPAALPREQWDILDPHVRLIGDARSATPFPTEVTVTIRNRSEVGFYEPNVVVVIADAEGRPRAIGALVMDRIFSLEVRQLIFRFPTRLTGTANPAVFINVDKMSEDRMIR